MPATRAVLYLRRSVKSTEDSVSIDVQRDGATAYAKRRGWDVVGEFVDDGVSASKNAPDARKGWRTMQDASTEWDVVVAWKLDRFTRSIGDLWVVHQWMKTNGKSVATVDGELDMTTTEGQMIATIKAGVAQKFAEDHSRRVTDAHARLRSERRAVGGTVPYGWKNVDNPEGGGKVVRQDPDRIEWVRGMVERVQRGDTLYSVKRWLDDAGAPLPKGSQQNRKDGTGWRYSTVERLLRHPILAGAVTCNPGNQGKQRGDGLLLDDNGLPYVNPSAAIMTLPEWRALVAMLDNRNSPQSRPRHTKHQTSQLLAGFLYCGADGSDGRDSKHPGEQPKMYRGTTQSRDGFQCPTCFHTITNVQDELVAEFLRVKGDDMKWSVVREVHKSGADSLPEIAHQIKETTAALGATDDEDEEAVLQARLSSLKKLRREKQNSPDEVVEVWNPSDAPFNVLWDRAGDDAEAQRAVLSDAVSRVVVRRGRPGRRRAGDALKRLEITWGGPHSQRGPVE